MIYLGNTPVGVGIKGVGEFTKYQRTSATPTDVGNLAFSHNLGVVPKLIIVSSQQTYVSTQYMTDGVINQKVGGFRYMSGESTYGNYYYVVEIDGSGTTTQKAYISSTNVTIYKGAATRYFNKNTEYTIDLYA